MTEGGGAAAGGDRDLLEEADTLIASLESHADPGVRTQVKALLEVIDVVHRTGLTKLMDAIRAMAGDAFVNRLYRDPGIRFLLMSYDLIPIDRRLQAEEALDAVRGHLHAHGVDPEILEVVGGVVYLHVHGLRAGGPPLASVLRDVEAALKAGFVGFQELVLREREARPAPGGLVTLGARKLLRPVYRRALGASELSPGTMKPVELDGLPVLLANVDGDVYALRDQCGDSPFPLHLGALNGAEIRCAIHGCRYDVRSGRLLEGDGENAQVFPVRVEGSGILVAVGTEPAGPR